MLHIYKASAGSGKTYTLVKEYLRMALSENNDAAYGHILAITFTNKAANEMKERILTELENLSNPLEDSALLLELCALTNLPARELRARARAVHYHMLHHYSNVAVCTIDSFTHRLVRCFAYDLSLPANFEVELDGDKLLEKVVAQLIQDVSADKESPITQALLEFVEEAMNEGKTWNIEANLARFARELFAENATPFLHRLVTIEPEKFSTTQKKLYAMLRAFETQVKQAAAKATGLIQSNNLDANCFFQGNKGIGAYFFRLEKFAGELNDLSPNNNVQKTINGDKWYSNKKGHEAIQARIDAVKHELKAHYQILQQIIERGKSEYTIVKVLLANFHSFRLLAEVNTYLKKYQRQECILHISEFQQKISSVVSVQDAPVIYERLGNYYTQILIDEFQDTSMLQWRNLVPLVENSQTLVKDSLLVGDGKQAIYRFRGGEVAQFVALPKIFGSENDDILLGRETTIANYGTITLNLEKNFRSRNEIIAFNNALYNFLNKDERFALREIYNESEQQTGKNIPGGFVQLEFLPAENKETKREKRNLRIEKLICEMQAKGYRYKDIAILSRGNETCSNIAIHLLQCGIPVVSGESLLIHQHHAVKTLLSALQYLTDRDNSIKRCELLYYLQAETIAHGKCDHIAFLYAPHWDFEKQLSVWCAHVFHSDTLLALRLPLLVDKLAQVLRIDAFSNSFVQFFRDEVLAYAARYGNRISEFLDWWNVRKNTASVKFPDSLDAVRIMTIHKSKGLQFPVVILADADFSMSTDAPMQWIDLQPYIKTDLPFYPLKPVKDLEGTALEFLYTRERHNKQLDMINLLYVATTRAEEQLFILSKEGKEKYVTELNSGNAIYTSFLQSQNRWKTYETYTWGDPATVAIKKQEAAMDKFILSSFETGGYRTLRYKRNKVTSKHTQDAVHFGQLLHKLLAQITHEKDLPARLQKMATENSWIEPLPQRLLAAAMGVLHHPQLQKYFSDEYVAYNERSLVSNGRKKIPDKILFSKETNTHVLLDFKTGEAHDAHEIQLREYASLLRQSGAQVSGAYLVYTNSNEVKEIML